MQFIERTLYTVSSSISRLQLHIIIVTGATLCVSPARATRFGTKKRVVSKANSVHVVITLATTVCVISIDHGSLLFGAKNYVPGVRVNRLVVFELCNARSNEKFSLHGRPTLREYIT